MEPTGKNVILCIFGTIIIWLVTYIVFGDKPNEDVMFIPMMATFFTSIMIVFWAQYEKPKKHRRTNELEE